MDEENKNKNKNECKQEIEGWIDKIDRQIERETDEWAKERLKIEKAAYVRTLKLLKLFWEKKESELLKYYVT